MLEKLKQIDIDLFVFLNGLGSVTWDPFWEMVTGFYCWIPFFAVIIYYTFKKLGRQHAFLALSMVMLALFFTDETTTLIKHGVKRLRPCNNPAILHFIRAVQQNNSFSFVSGHSSTSMAVAFLSYCILRPYIKYIGLFFIWPLAFGFSRIYLGLHYPGDILAGYLYGLFTGWVVLQLYKLLKNKRFPQFNDLNNPAHGKPVSNG